MTLVANFAAVHREPGHEDWEYFETNLYGAEHVCAWTVAIGCNRMVFTSSIAPYETSETEKDEATLPVPDSAYGSSKLSAEKIHLGWQNGDAAKRQLVFVRPGVVFGPSEGGNVSRLIKAVLHGYFFYMGNKNTRKAGVYIKELCHALWWVVQLQSTTGESVSLFNMTMNPGPTIQDYTNAVCKVSGVKRWIPSIPHHVLWLSSYLIDMIAKPLGISHPFSPVRIRKLVRSNNIQPSYLVTHEYPYEFTLETALIDWKKSCPADWR